MYLLPLMFVGGTVAFLVALAFAPIRRRRGLGMSLTIRADRNRVWDLLMSAYGPRSWRPEVASLQPSAQDPDLIEQVCAFRGHRILVVMRILEAVAGEHVVMRCERIGKAALPLGANSFSAVKLVDRGDRVRLLYREEGEFDTVVSCLMFWISQRSAFQRLKRHAEGETAPRPEASMLRTPPLHLVVGSAIAAAAIAAMVGWQFGILVFAFLAIMEYGHALVLRWAGGRPSFVALLPFVGGALAMTRRPTNALWQAIRALSGPAALTLIVMALTVAGVVAGEGDFADNSRLAAGVAAGLVAVFLLPFYPLNGGWLFDALSANLPRGAFLVPALIASGAVLVWSVLSGAVLAAALSAALVYELITPRRSAVSRDGSLSSRHALMLTGAYAGMNLIAHATVAQIFVA